MLCYNKPMRKGFTLIEMLIVIAIIGILASMVLVGLGPVQRQGRDSRRISDLRQVQNALELYYNKCGFYPGPVQTNAASCSSYVQITTWSSLTTSLSGTGSVIGINSIPNDPSSGKDYFYGTNSVGSSYVLGAQLEDVNNPNLSQSLKTDTFGVSCSTSGMYCIQF